MRWGTVIAETSPIISWGAAPTFVFGFCFDDSAPLLALPFGLAKIKAAMTAVFPMPYGRCVSVRPRGKANARHFQMQTHSTTTPQAIPPRPPRPACSNSSHSIDASEKYPLRL